MKSIARTHRGFVEVIIQLDSAEKDTIRAKRRRWADQNPSLGDGTFHGTVAKQLGSGTSGGGDFVPMTFIFTPEKVQAMVLTSESATELVEGACRRILNAYEQV